jgi:hypothetical protein
MYHIFTSLSVRWERTRVRYWRRRGRGTGEEIEDRIGISGLILFFAAGVLALRAFLFLFPRLPHGKHCTILIT